MRWVVNSTPWLLPLGKRPGFHFTRGHMGFGAGLDGYGKYRLHQDLIPRSPQQAALPPVVALSFNNGVDGSDGV